MIDLEKIVEEIQKTNGGLTEKQIEYLMGVSEVFGNKLRPVILEFIDRKEFKALDIVAMGTVFQSCVDKCLASTPAVLIKEKIDTVQREQSDDLH